MLPSAKKISGIVPSFFGGKKKEAAAVTAQRRRQEKMFGENSPSWGSAHTGDEWPREHRPRGHGFDRRSVDRALL